jgi:hypothetical protein
VFLLGAGRPAVFDPLPRWAVPRFEDLCRFLVALRLQGLQLHTHGLAYGRAELDRHEQQVIEGYRGDEQLSLPELRCFQLLITLDKWSALVDSPSGGVTGRLRGASVAAATGFLSREAGRVLDLGESGA